MTIRADALAQVEAYFDSGRFLEELADLIAVPSESQDPRGAPHLRSYLEEQMVPRLAALGFTADRVGNITCPIGDPALGKHPQSIAIGVATALLRNATYNSLKKDLSA